MGSKSEVSILPNLSRSGVGAAYLSPGQYSLLAAISSIINKAVLNSIEVIKQLDYAAPTSIQAQAIPAIMSGRDIIGVAKTGSGKTMAFILPMFRHIKDQRPIKTMEGPIAMIMTPTRELATQIHRECRPFLKALGLRASLSPSFDNFRPCIDLSTRRHHVLTEEPLSKTISRT